MWETEADLRGRTLTNFVDHISGGPPVREVYEVSVYDRLQLELGKATHARVTTRQVQSGKMDDVIHTYLNSAVHLRRQQGSIGAILLTDRDTGNAVKVTLGKSESQMDAAALPAVWIAVQSGSMPVKLTRSALIFSPLISRICCDNDWASV